MILPRLVLRRMAVRLQSRSDTDLKDLLKHYEIRLASLNDEDYNRYSKSINQTLHFHGMPSLHDILRIFLMHNKISLSELRLPVLQSRCKSSCIYTSGDESLRIFFCFRDFS